MLMTSKTLQTKTMSAYNLDLHATLAPPMILHAALVLVVSLSVPGLLSILWTSPIRRREMMTTMRAMTEDLSGPLPLEINSTF